MDIDKAINESDDRRLKTKYENAIYVIKRALSLYSLDEVAFSFNGGKDSTVLFHLLRAGHYMHKWSRIHSKGALPDNKVQFPVRTLYFESPCAFPEIDTFTHVTAESYGVQMDIIKLDFKSGLEGLLKCNPVRAIFLGVRIGDPTAVGQEQFSPSSPGWPPFMRINPILDWSYRDVWAFILTCKVRYCSLYDQGYTSIGSRYDTVPNSLLRVHDSSCNKEKFRPAYLLSDGRLERAGRVKRSPCPASDLSLPISNGLMKMDIHQSTALVAGVITVGDEILSGIVKDEIGPMLLKKLHSIGWTVSQTSVVRNEVDSVADEVEKWKSKHDMVFIYGGVGPLPSDITMAGVAKAFGVRLAPDEEFEEYLRHLIGDHCTGDRNEMAQLPETITQLIHHVNLDAPLIKCDNVIVFNATNVKEFENEWESLMDLTTSSGFLPLPLPFISRYFSSHLLDVEAAPYLLQVSLQHPDISIESYRGARSGPLYINFRAKDEADIEMAIGALFESFPEGSISEIK